MNRSPHHQDLIRQYSKDEAAYEQLIALFDELAAPATPPAASPLLPNDFARIVADHVPVAIYVWSADDFSLVYGNAQYEGQLGYSLAEIRALGPAFLERVYHPDDAERWHESDRQLLQDREGKVYENEYRVIRADETVGCVFVREMVLNRHADGRPRHIIGIAQDITERKQAERQEFELSLERERMKLLAQFIQHATHEFRTPLSTISVNSYLLAHAENDQTCTSHLRNIERQVQHITRLVESILAIVELEHQEPASHRPVNLAAVIASLVDEMRTQHANGPALLVEIPPDLPSVPGNEDQLREMLRQLLDNAYQFSPAGSTVTLKTGHGATHLWLEVEDSGPGITDEALPHIFETFWRQDVAHSTPGLGLGLAIVRKIVQQHQGQISVQSTPGEGSCFRITLPLEGGSLTPPAGAARSSS